MGRRINKKERPIVSMGRDEREELWDDLYLKEAGVVLEFDSVSEVGLVTIASHPVAAGNRQKPGEEASLNPHSVLGSPVS